MAKPKVNKLDFIVFIGRFQIFHNAHLEVIKQALELSEKVIVVIGSAYKPRTPKDPFTVGERREMILLALQENDLDINRVFFTWARDYLYNDQQWVREVQRNVNACIHEYNPKIGIIGLKKDESSYYLDLFPQWEFIGVRKFWVIGATEIRDRYFDSGALNELSDNIASSTFSFLYNYFFHKEEYLQIQAEHKFLDNYKSKFKALPYGQPIFVTTDAVVIQSGHVLLVKRKSIPGKGLYALPGGFLNSKETIEHGVVRELLEETKIKVPEKILYSKAKLENSHVFDHPNRSLRGRTITHAFLFDLQSGPLPKVKGSDDAQKAEWVPLDKLENMTDKLFEDHFDIINYFLGKV
jgi:bifunctional NMN adenylyltransferase/nudix hydrolase